MELYILTISPGVLSSTGNMMITGVSKDILFIEGSPNLMRTLTPVMSGTYPVANNTGLNKTSVNADQSKFKILVPALYTTPAGTVSI